MSGITWKIEPTSPIMGFFTYYGVQPSSPIMASTCFTSEVFSLLGVTLVCHGILELPALVWQRSGQASAMSSQASEPTGEGRNKEVMSGQASEPTGIFSFMLGVEFYQG